MIEEPLDVAIEYPVYLSADDSLVQCIKRVMGTHAPDVIHSRLRPAAYIPQLLRLQPPHPDC